MNWQYIQLYTAIFMFFVFPILMFSFAIYWWRKHIFFISIYKREEGSYYNSGGRYRLVDGHFYPIFKLNLFNKTVPLNLNGHFIKYRKVKSYIIAAEGLPIFGVKKILKLKQYGDKITPWRPTLTLTTKGIVKDTLLVEINNLRKELYDTTKTPLSKNELLMKVAIPMGLIILALAMLIFFPKIYESIMTQSVSNYDQITNQVFDWLGQNKPLG